MRHTIQALLAAALCAAAQTPSAETGIAAATVQLREALQQGNAERLADMYTPDAQLILPGQTLSGHEAVLAHAKAAVAAGLRDFRNQDQEFFSGDGLVVETGRTSFYNAAGTLLGTDRYMTVWKKLDVGWRILRDMAVPEKMAAQSSAAAKPAAFAVKQVQPYTTMVLPMTGNYSQSSAAIGRVAGGLGVEPAGPPFSIYFNSPTSVRESELKWEVGFPVPKGAAASAPFAVREFPEQTVAFAVIAGPYEAQRPWSQLIEWAIRQGYQIAGPAMEIWMEGPKTEMRIPVRK